MHTKNTNSSLILQTYTEHIVTDRDTHDVHTNRFYTAQQHHGYVNSCSWQRKNGYSWGCCSLVRYTECSPAVWPLLLASRTERHADCGIQMNQWHWNIRQTHTWWHNGRSYDTHNDSCWVIDSHRHTHKHRHIDTDSHTQIHTHWHAHTKTPTYIWHLLWYETDAIVSIYSVTKLWFDCLGHLVLWCWSWPVKDWKRFPIASCILVRLHNTRPTHTSPTHPPHTHNDHHSPTQHRRQIDRRHLCWAVTSICHTQWTTHHHRTPAVGLHIQCCRQRVVQRVWMWCLHRYKKGTNVQSASTHNMIFWLSHHLENGSRSLKLVWMCKVNVIVMKSFKHLLKQHPW